jgi:hypothetical protein
MRSVGALSLTVVLAIGACNARALAQEDKQSTWRVTPYIGAFILDDATDSFHLVGARSLSQFRTLSVDQGYELYFGTKLARRAGRLGDLELTVGYAKVEQGVATNTTDEFGSTPSVDGLTIARTPIQLYVIKLELRRQVASLGPVGLTIGGGGGLIVLDPGENRPRPLGPEVENVSTGEIGSVTDPIASLSVGLRYPLSEELALRADLEDNVHLCEMDRETTGQYLCSLGTLLHHVALSTGLEFRF